MSESPSRAPYVYLAGPFFNQPQLDLIKHIEQACDAIQLPYFSPRQQGVIDKSIEQPVPVKGSKPMAKKVFDGNFMKIKECTHMIAVLDYPLPEGQSLAVIARTIGKEEVIRRMVLPDTGTIWEMGVAYALGIPVIGLSMGRHGYLNLMLTESMVGVVGSGTELHDLLVSIKEQKSLSVGPWTGSYS